MRQSLLNSIFSKLNINFTIKECEKHPILFNTKIYEDAEAEAKIAHRSMWIQGDKYVSPRNWRRMQQKKL
jgi:hypothetical protein